MRLTLYFVALGIGIAAAYVSLRTGQTTQTDATVKVFKDLEAARVEQARIDKEADQRTLDALMAAIKAEYQPLDNLANQNKAVLDQVKALAEQVKDISLQTNDITKNVAKVLEEHTQSFKEAKAASIQARNAAQSSEVATRKAIKDLKPKPSWWQRLTQPTPTQSTRRK